jgi:hypothetical protein
MNGLHHHFAPSPDRERLHTFESRFRAASDFALPPRRGSTLSEDIRPVMEDEEVDWEGDVPDSDDCVSDSDDDMDDGLPQGHGITSAPADWNLAAVLDNIERKQRRSPAKTVRGHSLLRPADGMDFSRLGSKQASASYASFSSQHSAPPQLGVVHAHALANTGGGSSGSLSSGAGAGAAGALSSVTASGTASVPVPFRMPPSAFRARSPLGDSPAYSYSKPTSASITPGTVTPEAERERDINHNRDHNRDQFQDADEDDGLVLGLRRGRKGSSLSRQSSVMSKSPPVQLQQ